MCICIIYQIISITNKKSKLEGQEGQSVCAMG